MSTFQLAGRFVRKYLLSQQAILTWSVVFVLYLVLLHHASLLNFCRRCRIRLQVMLTGKYSTVISERISETEITAEKTKASWELKKGNVGVYAIQGRRQHMEDRFNVVNDLEHTGTSIYGIFDGHGGEFAADFVEKTLFKTIMVRLLKSALNTTTKQNFSSILTEEILYVDKQLLAVEKMTNEVSGTTGLVALLKGNQLTVANVGDSRGVMCTENGKAIPLSYDHKPQQLKERKRIKESGGFISFNGVWRVAGVLATSRAFGDNPLKEKNLIIADPDILNFDLKETKAQFMILATDGLWDAFTNEEAVMYVKHRLDEPHFGAKSIVLQAYYRGSLDNITVMVVNFKANQTAVYNRKGSSA
ncbi:protein phosphatase 1L-like [Lineus longissimus]|uniref:protein phosphatase 1L-like n=1 Tax=Lineus longissimus TaxID=88925 RepID=UPI002B4C5CF1